MQSKKDEIQVNEQQQDAAYPAAIWMGRTGL
jgi:hypothetical protein